MSLKKRHRRGELVKLFSVLEYPLKMNNYLAPTSNGCFGSWFYVTKSETRVSGPWSDKDKDDYFPIHYRVEKLYPFQQAIIDKVKEEGESGKNRIVNILYDPVGSIGKSLVVGRLVCEKRGYLVISQNLVDL